MVVPAQGDEIIETRFAAVDPVPDVVGIGPAMLGTARKAAAVISD